MTKVIKCSRCGRRQRRLDGWNFTVENGAIVGHLCPDCQTPEENAEAEINEATLIYGTNQYGKLAMWPKTDLLD